MLPNTVAQFNTSFPTKLTMLFIIVSLSILPVIAEVNNSFTSISLKVFCVYFCASFIKLDMFNSSCCDCKTSWLVVSVAMQMLGIKIKNKIVMINIFFICLIPFYGNSFNIVSKRLAIIGIDIEIIKTFPPKSTLLAIAVSPVSLQMLTVNSVKNAIPVIFIRSIRNSLFIAVLFDNVVSKSIIAPILSIIITKISTPAAKETYSTNSGLYCFTITIIISEISPNSNNFNYIHCLLSFLIVQTSFLH